MTAVFLNGVITTLQAAEGPKVSALDAGLQHGVGLFETMLGGWAAGGRAWALHLEEHLARLAGSARELGLSNDLHEGPLGDAVLATVARSGLARARVRLTITGGDLNLLSRGVGGGTGQPHDPTVMIVAQPATEYPAKMIEQGVLVCIATTRANPLNAQEGHKTLNYWWRLRELQGAGAKGGAEGLVFSIHNLLVGGCVSNALLIRGGKMITPRARGEDETVETIPSAARAGVTREWAIRAAAGMGVVCEKRDVTIEDVLSAEEMLLTNSSWGVLPVTRVEGKGLGSGTVGPVGEGLSREWKKEIQGAAALA